MAREVMYRHSFHSDGDYKGVETMLKLDREVALQRASADGGFDAPRNSLDVPLLELRWHSEVRGEEVPIGDRLFRSLTTRQRGGELSKPKSVTWSNDIAHLKPKGKSYLGLEPVQKPRAPSIVARLMGLDALIPHHENLQCSGESASRRTLSQETMVSHKVAILCHQDPTPVRASDKSGNTEDEKLRNYPQEKQLQEFKREFTARKAFQGRRSLSNSCELCTVLQEEEEMQDPAQQELNMDSEEFLDALDFLNANKEFFNRILNEPNSLFTKYFQHPGHPNLRAADGDRPRGTRLTRSFPESITKACSSFLLANGSAEASEQEMNQHNRNEKARAIRSFPWGQDEEMLGHPESHARAMVMEPTRIVVLKPNLGKLASRKLFSPSSPLSHKDAKLRKRIGDRENVKHGVENRYQSMAGVSKEFLNDTVKDGLKDARDIARQVVNQVKKDVSQRLLNDGSHISEPLVPSIARCHRDAASSRRDNYRPHSSLPSSHHFCRSGRRNDSEHFGSNMKREEEVISRRTSKVNCQARASKDACSKQTADRDPNSVAGGRKMGKMNSSKAKEFGLEVHKVLPRSLSAPAATSMHNTAFACEKEESSRRATWTSKAGAAEGSPFKERLLSLKDSFLLTKRKSSKKHSNSQHNSPLDSLELSTPRQADVGNVLSATEIDESSPTLFTYRWPITSIMKDGDAKEAAMENGVSEVFSDNSPPMHTSTGQHHCAGLVDSALETSLDKCEQTSPVSVLETPFQEESPSSLDIRGTDSKNHDLEHVKPNFSELPNNLQGLFFLQPSSQHSSLDFSDNEPSSTWNPFYDYLESFSISHVTCPLVSEEELTYIRHILSLSGFTGHGLVTAHALSSDHGLKPSTFGMLEDYYAERSAVAFDNFPAPLDPMYRRLLFDVVDKIVFLKRRKLTNPSSPLVGSGRELLEDVVGELSSHRFSPSKALEDAAARDLLKEDSWLPSQLDRQAVAMELERLLCGDLIRELVYEYLRR